MTHEKMQGELDGWIGNQRGLFDFVKRVAIRADCHGAYSTTGKPWTCKEPITVSKLSNHFVGNQTIGVHVVSPTGNMAKVVIFDIDLHDEPKPHKGDDQAAPADPTKNLEYARHLWGKYKQLGIDSLLFDSNGKGGYHLWTVFDFPMSAGLLRSFGLWMTRDAIDFGVTPPEVFPKQDAIKPDGFGNWVRLPGKHHKREFYTKVWDGSGWLSGDGAAKKIIEYMPQAVTLIPAEALNYTPPPKVRQPRPTEWEGDYDSEQWWKNYSGDLKTLDVVGLFQAEDLYIRADGEKHLVVCPWHDSHTTDSEGTACWKSDSSFPGWNCLHAHCEGKTLEDVLAFFGKDKVDSHCAKKFDKGTGIDDSLIDSLIPQVDKETVSPFVGSPVDHGATNGKSNLQKSERTAADIASDVLGVKLKQKSPDLIQFESWDDTCAIAAEQREDWLIPHWAEFGCLHILTGLPFSGKSYLITELVGCICTGRDFYTMPVQQVPFIILDLENKERILVKRIKASLANDPGRINELYRRVNPKNMPRPLTREFMKECITQLKAGMNGTKGVLIVDTLRSAFAGSGMKEDKNDDMAALLYPLQALAQETGWAIILLHHNTKGQNHYSGAGVIAGAADYLWNWTSDKKKLTACLEMDGGRDDHQFPLEFRFDMATQRNVYLGKSNDIKRDDAKKQLDRLLTPWLTLLPDDPEDGITIAEIQKRAFDAGMFKEDVKEDSQEKETRRVMDEALNLKYVQKKGAGKRGSPAKWFTTEAGRVVRLEN